MKSALQRMILRMVAMVVFVTTAYSTMAQTAGDYRSAGVGNWSALATWVRYNGTAWVAPTSGQGYPGQNTGTGNVIIRFAGSVTLDVSPANAIGSLNVGDGTATNSGLGNGAAQLTIGANTLSITGNIVISNANGQRAGTLNNGTGTVRCAGALSTAGGGTYTASTGTFEYNGTGVQSIFTTAYHNLSVSNGSTKSLAASITATGALTVRANTIFSLGAFNYTSVSVNLECGASSSAASITGTGTLSPGGNITVTNNAGGTIGAIISAPVPLAATRTLTVADDGTAATDLTISSVISGAGFGLIKNGTGALSLSAANTFTGGVTLNAGKLNVNNASALGTTAGTLTINGGIIDNTTGALITTLNYPQTWAGDFTFGGTRDLNLGTGAVTLTGNRTVTLSGATLTISGVISGSFGLTKVGIGALTLNGANVFTGGTTLVGGTLSVGNASALGAASGVFTVTGGSLNNNTNAPITLVNYPIALNGNLFFIGTSSLNLGAGALTMNNDRQITVNANVLSFDGTISQPTRSLTKLGSGTLGFGANSIELNSLNISSGTLISTSGDLSLSGDFTNTATFDHNSGTVIFTGGAAIQTITNIDGEIFNNLSLNKSTGLVLMGGNVTVNGTLLLSLSAGVFGVQTNTLTINGSLTRTSGTISAASGTVTFGGNTVQTVGANIFNANTIGTLNILNTSGVNFNGSVSIVNNMNVVGLFTPAASIVIGGTGTLAGSGTIQVTSSGSSDDLAAQYSLNRTVNNLTVEYIGAAAQFAGIATYGGLKISNTNGVSLAGNATTNALNLNTGNLAILSNTLTINGAVTRSSGNLVGSNTSNLVIGGAAGTLYFQQTVPNNFLRSLTINTGASATLGTRVNITGYDGTSEGVVAVNGTGSLISTGLLVLKSNANGTARIAQGRSTGGYISGSVIVERFVPQNASKAWRLLASNTSGQTISQGWQENQTGFNSNTNPGFGTMISGNFPSLSAALAEGYDTVTASGSLLRYNAPTDELLQVANTNATDFGTEQGYFIYIRGDRSPNQFGASLIPTTSTTLRSRGLLFQGDQPASTVIADGLALLRNPYASAIDLRNINIGGGTVNAFQVWDPKLAGSFNLGGFQTLTFNSITGNYLITPGGGSYGVSGSVVNTIESGSAFFAQATGSAGTVQIPESAKTAGSKLVLRPASPLATPSLISTNLYYRNGGSFSLADGNTVYFDDSYDNSFTKDDVRKNANFGEDFAMLKEGVDLVVETRQVPTTMEDSIQFNMRRLKRANYRLEISGSLIAPDMYATLEDKFTNNSVLINLTGITTYDFSVTTNTASSAIDRFKIKLTPTVVLPVLFTSIKAAQLNKDVNVEWKVSNQLSVAKYEIEKSPNGRSFATAGSQVAANGSGELTYNWTDKTPQQGANYYRIKSIDISGKVGYTSIAKVVINQKGTGVGLYPNPVRPTESLNIQLVNQPAGTYNIRIVNPVGQEVHRQVLQHAGGSASQSIITLGTLTNGAYQVQVINKEKVVATQQLIIKN